MARQELGHAQAVFVVPLHPQFERFQAALQQIKIVRAVDRAHDAAQLADRLQLFRRSRSITPASRSLWPARYLVAECST